AQYERELEALCRRLTEIDSGLDFKVSARGWAYILEEHGLTKGDFDAAERLITDCRKRGLLPVDFCAEDEGRGVDHLHENCRPNAGKSEHGGPLAHRRSNGQEIVMSIGRRRGSGSGPLLKYDARNGAFYRVDRNAGGEVEQTSVVDLKAVFDLANLEIGWIRFDAGAPPSFKMVRAGQDIGNPP